MAQTIIDNINSILNTKSELQTILVENGQEGGDVFSQYPDQFRAAIASSGASEEAVNSYISAYLNTYNYIDQDTLSSNSYITESDVAQMGYITMGDVSACGYITQHQDLSSYATKSYVVDYVATYAPTPDLSSYVTKTELSAQSYLTSHQDLSGYVSKTELSSCGYITINDVPSTDLSNYVTYGYANANYVSYSYAYNTFVSYSYLGDIEEITEYILGSGSSSAPENIYATKAELNSYISKTSLESMSYITESDVAEMGYITMGDVSACGYITAGDIPSVVVPVIDENIIPKQTTTYTLGDSTHIYSNTYSRGVYLGTGVRMFSESSAASNDMAISLDGVSYFYLNTNRFAPNGAANNEKLDLGTADRKWNHIYGKSVNVDATYTNTAYLQDTSYSSSIVPKETNTYTLGDASHLYSNAYTNNIFMDGHSITYRNSTSILFSIANRDNFIMLSSAFCPSRVGMNLGLDYTSNKWFSTYTSNIYADNAYISNIHNFIWTGTSAEYASLSDYTSYQIYLIKES